MATVILLDGNAANADFCFSTAQTIVKSRLLYAEVPGVPLVARAFKRTTIPSAKFSLVSESL